MRSYRIVTYDIWQVEASNEAMLVFVRRYLQPYVVKQTERRLARQVLGAMGEEDGRCPLLRLWQWNNKRLYQCSQHPPGGGGC